MKIKNFNKEEYKNLKDMIINRLGNIKDNLSNVNDLNHNILISPFFLSFLLNNHNITKSLSEKMSDEIKIEILNIFINRESIYIEEETKAPNSLYFLIKNEGFFVDIIEKAFKNWYPLEEKIND